MKNSTTKKGSLRNFCYSKGYHYALIFYGMSHFVTITITISLSLEISFLDNGNFDC